MLLCISFILLYFCSIFVGAKKRKCVNGRYCIYTKDRFVGTSLAFFKFTDDLTGTVQYCHLLLALSRIYKISFV